MGTTLRTELTRTSEEQGTGTSGARAGTNAVIVALYEADDRTGGRPETCRGVTRGGKPCRRRPRNDGFCSQHGKGDGRGPGPGPAGDRTAEAAPQEFYGRVLSVAERTVYAQALAQQGLVAEVAVLRLHLLRLIERDDPDRPGEIPRTVHALVRALNDLKEARTSVDDKGMSERETLDAAVREEGRRLLDDEDAVTFPLLTEAAAPVSASPVVQRKSGGRERKA